MTPLAWTLKPIIACIFKFEHESQNYDRNNIKIDIKAWPFNHVTNEKICEIGEGCCKRVLPIQALKAIICWDKTENKANCCLNENLARPISKPKNLSKNLAILMLYILIMKH